jgi:arylformamidase
MPAQSAAHQPAGHLGLAYGETSRERLDLFLAADPQAPTLVFFHGGYWQINDLVKESFAFFAEALLPLGINLAVIEYTLAPTARLDRIVGEVRRSVRWLAEHLGEYGSTARTRTGYTSPDIRLAVT